MGEWNILLYFGNMRLSSAALDGFFKDVKVTNHTWLSNAELTWYFSSAIHWICLYGLEHRLSIDGFRSTWPCLIVEVFATQTKFFEQSGCFCGIKAQFELIMQKLLNEAMLHVHLCSFLITHGVKQYTTCLHNYLNTTSSGTSHGLNYFSYVMYVLQTGTY